MSSPRRELVKSNWLQHKICKRSGTLIRKKKNLQGLLKELCSMRWKIRYEEAEWVVLCVHDDRIPLLEWYFSEECAKDHRPTKVVDLLDSAFVTPVISDTRSFIIGFTHASREPLELAALTSEDCTDWVQTATATLLRLRCLSDSTNVYSALPDPATVLNPSEPPPERPLEFSLDDEAPRSCAPVAVSSPDAAFSSHDDAAPYERLVLARDLSNLSTSELSSEESNTVRLCDIDKPTNSRLSCGKDLPPPLPPRHSPRTSASPIASPRAESVYDFPKNCVTSPQGTYDTFDASWRCRASTSNSCVSPTSPPSRPSEYGTLAGEVSSVLTQEVKPQPVSSSKRPDVKRGYSIPSSVIAPQRVSVSTRSESTSSIRLNGFLKRNGYDIPASVSPLASLERETDASECRIPSQAPPPLPPPPIPPSTRLGVDVPAVVVGDSNESTVNRRWSVSPSRPLKSPVQQVDTALYASPRGSCTAELTPIALQLMLCVESIAFAQVNGRVWIAGWSAMSDKHLAGVLRVGDELVKVGGVQVESTDQLPALFYSGSAPGSPVNLSIRQVPYGTEFTLKKTRRNFDLGVVLRKHKNRLEEVKEGSPAFQAGIRAHILGMNGTMTATCVTHLNGRALSFFSRNDDVLKLVDQIPVMASFTLLMQPYDLVKQLKRSIKALKNYGLYVHD